MPDERVSKDLQCEVPADACEWTATADDKGKLDFRPVERPKKTIDGGYNGPVDVSSVGDD